MSTFNGIVPEFPDIRIDNFRPARNPEIANPLACFLSHVHSDHLAGLESLKSTFVYCSLPTRQILLRIERYPHRINYAKGILEARKQQYKHLRRLLKPIPLETRTQIEISPKNQIQVTLFDANHCVGSVMFLIENETNAILYTGDVRSEPWFVNSIVRNPCILEYTSGVRTLNTIYLDTTNIDPVFFPTKTEGLQELIRKVKEYPPNTKFHFSAYTYGYEDVWLALSKALDSPVHLDSYKLRLYQALSEDKGTNSDSAPSSQYGPSLLGFKCANAFHRGILTSDENARIHSCEKGTCSAVDSSFVWIRPIVRRDHGLEVPDKGEGGGAGDLRERPELMLEENSAKTLLQSFETTDSPLKEEMKEIIGRTLNSATRTLLLESFDVCQRTGLTVEDVANCVVSAIANSREETSAVIFKQKRETGAKEELPKLISFPYSRHASYPELLGLVSAFKPVDVYPCVVRPDRWRRDTTVRSLFSGCCSGNIFRFDAENNQENSYSIESTPFNPCSALDGLPSPFQATTPEPQFSSSIIATNRSTFAAQTTAFHGLRTLSAPISPIAIRSKSKRRNEAIYPTNDMEQRKRMRSDDDTHDQIPEVIDLRSSPEVGTAKANGAPIYDPQDDVYRCTNCGWELWTPKGNCSACDLGPIPYFEVLRPETTARDLRPGIVPSEEFSGSDVDEHERLELAGEYLDGISGYDSSESEHSIGYEIDSFVCDSPTPIGSLLSSASSDEEDIRRQNESLSNSNKELMTSLKNILDENEELQDEIDDLKEQQRGLLSSDFYDSDIDLSIDMDDDPTNHGSTCNESEVEEGVDPQADHRPVTSNGHIIASIEEDDDLNTTSHTFPEIEL